MRFWYWLLSFGLALALTDSATGQNGDAGNTPSPTKRYTAKSGIGLGTNGFQTFHDFSRVNDLGFKDDFLSLLKSKTVREGLSLTKDQAAEIDNLRQERIETLTAQLSKTVVGMQSESDMADHFERYEEQIFSSLNVDQLAAFPTLKNLAELEALGFETVLKSKKFREQFDIESSEIQRTLDKFNELKADETVATKKMWREANEKLVAILSATEKGELDRILSDKKSWDEFLDSRLFLSQRDKIRPPKNRIDLVRFLKLTPVHRRLKLGPDQVEEIREILQLTRDSEKRLLLMEAVVTDEQWSQLLNYVAIKEVEKIGTVSALSQGFLSTELDIDDVRSEDLLSYGRMLYETTEKQIANQLPQDLRMAVKAMGPEKSQEILEWFGQR